MELEIIFKEKGKNIRASLNPTEKIKDLIVTIAEAFQIPQSEISKRCIKLPDGGILDERSTIKQCGLKSNSKVIFDIKPNDYPNNGSFITPYESNSPIELGIFIKEADKKTKAALLPSEKIKDLIDSISENMGLNPNEVSMRCLKTYPGEEILDDEKTIEEYGLKSGSLVIFDIKPSDILKIVLDIVGKNAFELEVSIFDNLYSIATELYKAIKDPSKEGIKIIDEFFIDGKVIDPSKSLQDLKIKNGARILMKKAFIGGQYCLKEIQYENS